MIPASEGAQGNEKDYEGPVSSDLIKPLAGCYLALQDSSQMKLIRKHDRELHIGRHKGLGLVIYDRWAQEELAADNVRLYIVSEKRMATFDKESVKHYLVPDNQAGEASLLTSAAEGYVNIRRNCRNTHCYECRRSLNSADFSICDTCGWIKCICGACGCQYRGRINTINSERYAPFKNQ